MQKLPDSQRLKEAVKDSSIFAAIYLICPAVGYAVIEAFDDENLKNIIKILKENFRAHRFQNAALAGYPVILSFQNLAPEVNPQKMTISVNKVI
nr:2599_t:CDS:2 [Entrophospora candida]